MHQHLFVVLQLMCVEKVEIFQALKKVDIFFFYYYNIYYSFTSYAYLWLVQAIKVHKFAVRCSFTNCSLSSIIYTKLTKKIK